MILFCTSYFLVFSRFGPARHIYFLCRRRPLLGSAKNVSTFYPMFPRIIPYSFKRGGASDLFRRTGSFDICVDQGRWEHVNTARRYIESALAEQMIFELSPAWLRRMQQARAHLFEFARSGGMGGRSRLFDDVLSL